MEIYTISNKVTLGVTEEEIINKLQNAVKYIVNEENKLERRCLINIVKN